jgi:hypothetical protein
MIVGERALPDAWAALSTTKVASVNRRALILLISMPTDTSATISQTP